MRRKIFLMELFLLALIITRRFTTDIPLSVFALLVTILIVLKYLREGFRLSILGILLSLAILLYG